MHPDVLNGQCQGRVSRILAVKVNNFQKVSFVYHLSKNLNANFTQHYCHVEYPFKLFDKMKTKESLRELSTCNKAIPVVEFSKLERFLAQNQL